MADAMTATTFWSKTAEVGECVEWTGWTNPAGYGRVGWEGGVVMAHRLAFYFRMGRWPDGILRHLCNNPPCVLHVVEGTHAENMQDAIAAGTHFPSLMTHCKRGHLFDEENTYIYDGRRHCRTCRRDQLRAAYWAKKAS